MNIEMDSYNSQFRKRIIFTSESDKALSDLLVKLDDWIVKTAIQLAEKENPHNPFEITIEDKHILAVRQRLQDALRL